MGRLFLSPQLGFRRAPWFGCLCAKPCSGFLPQSNEINDFDRKVDCAPALDGTCGSAWSIAVEPIPDSHRSEFGIQLAGANASQAEEQLICVVVRNTADFQALG